MGAIDREETVKALQQFMDRSFTCKLTEREQGFKDGVNYCIHYISKFAPEPSIDKQIGFDFSEECQWK